MGYGSPHSFPGERHDPGIGQLRHAIDEDRNGSRSEGRRLVMFTISVSCLLTGVVLAAVAQNSPRRRVALEWAGGTLLIAGLGLLGAGLRLFR